MKNNLIIIVLTILIFVSGIGGYFLGQKILLDSFLQEQEEIFFTFGQIKSINENSFTIETNFLEGNPSEQDEIKLIEITVNINEQTKFSKIAPSLENPEVEETEISFSDLREGNKVDIISSENIKGKTEITAVNVLVYEMGFN
jgi:hypothetical protein